MGKMVDLRKKKIEGVDKVVRELRLQGEHILKAAKNALQAGVAEMVVDAKQLCPVDTGTLRDSIKSMPIMNGAGCLFSASATVGEAYARKHPTTAGSAQVALGKNSGFNYAPYVEFDPRINKPFMYPTVVNDMGRVRARIRLAIEGAITNGNIRT